MFTCNPHVQGDIFSNEIFVNLFRWRYRKYTFLKGKFYTFTLILFIHVGTLKYIFYFSKVSMCSTQIQFDCLSQISGMKYVRNHFH